MGQALIQAFKIISNISTPLGLVVGLLAIFLVGLVVVFLRTKPGPIKETPKILVVMLLVTGALLSFGLFLFFLSIDSSV